MLKIHNDTVVYVHCPVGKTGGIELLFQLVDFLRNNNRKSYIVYNTLASIPEDYVKYNIELKFDIIDNSHNIEVFPEIMIQELMNDNHSTQKMLWWLSVNHFWGNDFLISTWDIFKWNKAMGVDWLKARFYCFLHRSDKYKLFGNISMRDINSKVDVNAYQCEYIRQFLMKFKFTNLVPLKDYINTDFTLNAVDYSKRDDIVLYNPSKGLEYTHNLMRIAPEIKWVPLKGFSREELMKILRSSKIYIDFGSHPGKDRLPRECAISGNCIITGKKGAAHNDVDIPIPKRYKIQESIINPKDIIGMIKYVLTNYETCIRDFEQYRMSIKKEKREFQNQIIELFEL